MRPNGLLLSASVVIVASGALASCNLITGAEDLVVESGGGEGGEGGSTTIGTGGNPTTTPTTTTEVIQPMLVDASGVSITQIALYQGVKAVLMENGAPGNNSVPIVAARDSLMRVWLSLDGNYNGKNVLARLTINGVDPPMEFTGAPPGAPSDSSLPSTLNFNIPGASLPPGAQFKIEILQPDTDSKGPNPNAHYPLDGFANTNAQNVGPTVKIVLVPIKYGADGSNRLPDLSEPQIQGYRDYFMAMYPVPSVDLTVRAAVQYNYDVSPNGYGWQELLGYIGDVRQGDGAPFEAYYYGIFSPASSVNNFCGGGCVAGLGNIGGPGDAYSRAAIGLGFPGDIAWETAVHEVGHTHGRYHSPCGGAQGTDPGYPYSGAGIGVWGYNILTGKLYSPQQYTDVMGYCFPIWISDYTYKGLFNRIKAVNGASLYVPPELKDRDYDRAWIDEAGDLHWLSSIHMEMPPQAEEVDLTVDTDDGTYGVTGHFYPYDHLPGGVFVWPQAGGPSSAVTVEWEGAVRSLVK